MNDEEYYKRRFEEVSRENERLKQEIAGLKKDVTRARSRIRDIDDDY